MTFTTKLVEKDVEVEYTETKMEKRLVEVYTFRDEEFDNIRWLKNAIARRMRNLFADAIDTTREKVGLAESTKVKCLTAGWNLRSPYNSLTLFEDGTVIEKISEMAELNKTLSELED
mgnify:CR=1 FL=1